MAGDAGRFARWLYMAGLMLGGESIYMLPYMRKTFQTSMEAVFGVTATEIGLVNSAFGILALLCYFPGGWLADAFSARKLLTVSLLATGGGGLFLLAEPGFAGLLGVHVFWGITSILTFWGALIKATREWGPPRRQGSSFGLLDAGRGVVAAVLASVATAGYAWAGSTAAGLETVIWIYSLAPMGAGIVIWMVVPDDLHASGPRTAGPAGGGRNRIREALGMPQVWLLAAVIFCAYMLYLGSFAFPAFAEKGLGQSRTFGAVVGTVRDWMRPVAALAAGLLADRFRASRTIAATFVLLIAAFASLAVVPPAAGGLWLLWSQVLLAGLAVFALRGIYFAVLEEAGIGHHLTGTAVGIVSFVGFMPDAFAHLLSGWLVDTFPGVMGYRYYFGLLAGVAGAGLLCARAVRSLGAGAAD